MPIPKPGFIEQLYQLYNGARWDGDLIDKSALKRLVEYGYAEKTPYGYNIITSKGIVALYELGFIHP